MAKDVHKQQTGMCHTSTNPASSAVVWQQFMRSPKNPQDNVQPSQYTSCLTFASHSCTKFRSAWMLTVNISNTCSNSTGVTNPSFCVLQILTSNKLCKGNFLYIKLCTHFLDTLQNEVPCMVGMMMTKASLSLPKVAFLLRPFWPVSTNTKHLSIAEIITWSPLPIHTNSMTRHQHG